MVDLVALVSCFLAHLILGIPLILSWRVGLQHAQDWSTAGIEAAIRASEKDLLPKWYLLGHPVMSSFASGVIIQIVAASPARVGLEIVTMSLVSYSIWSRRCGHPTRLYPSRFLSLPLMIALGYLFARYFTGN